MGFMSFIGGAIGSLVTAVLAPVVAPVIAALAPVLSAVAPILNAIAPALTALIQVAKVFGESSVEEMGERVLSSDKDLDDFDSFEEYRRYISERSVDLTKSKFSPEERFAAGLSFGVRCLEEDLGVSFNKETLELFGAHPEHFTEARVCAYVQALSKNRLNLDMLSQYFDERLPAQLELNVEAILIGCERELSPELSDAERLAQLREVGRA